MDKLQENTGLFEFMKRSDSVDNACIEPREPVAAKQQNRAAYTEQAIRDYFEANGRGKRKL